MEGTKMDMSALRKSAALIERLTFAHRFSAAAALSVAVVTSAPALGAIQGPYAADGDTLHLYHFDEAADATTVADSVAVGARDLTRSTPTETAAATLGNPAYPGFGSAGGVSGNGQIFRDAGDIGPAGFGLGPNGGAFTFEALVNIPDLGNSNRMIVTLDGNGGAADRVFQFRIAAGALGLTNIGGQALTVPIPRTGDDAYVANEWFHAAVTYTGDEAAADNVSFYWTRVDPSATVASQIGQASMTADLSGTETNFFTVGNIGRGANPSAPLNGLVDEVRVSSAARSANEFVFVPEPASAALVAAAAAFGLLTRRRRPQA